MDMNSDTTPATKPTESAIRYHEHGFWADVQDGSLVSYPAYQDGTWFDEPIGIEYACEHLIARVNADFGTSFTADDFEPDDDCAGGISAHSAHSAHG